MALLGTINKQPSEILDFDINYATTLAVGSDSLSTVQTSVSPSGLTIDSATVNVPNAKIKVKFSGGTTLVTYKITVQATTANGLKYEDEVSVIVEDV